MAREETVESGDAPAEPLPASEFKREMAEAIPYMRAFARSLAGNDSAADDLTQDALIKAWSARQRFRAGSNFRAWIFTIVRNQFYSNCRRSWRQVAWDQEQADRTLTGPSSMNGVLELDETRRALLELPDDQREAIILVGAGGFSYEEAANICGCAVGTVKSRVSRARSALAAILESGPRQRSATDKVRPSESANLIMAEVKSLTPGG
ncbi:MAG: RNA polymerase ECF subfamily sigma 70 factor [Oceanicaulis sp. HLUCCA04]|nr:MAG: RNA polymerase ECF subfamily sigma 70 factor [Oceanicaulis sp. HLUCCA04]